MTNWMNAEYVASYPQIPNKSNDADVSSPLTFPNPPNSQFICIVRPPSINNSILATLNYSFNTLDMFQNTTFFDVPEIESTYGELVNISASDPSVSNSMFFVHVSGQSNGNFFNFQ